jgi:hypothetical protein
VTQERIIVTIAGDQAAGIDPVVQRLREAGMQVDQVLGAIGMVTGSAPASRWPQIEAVPGVVSVEREGSFRLPPPDSEVQ